MVGRRKQGRGAAAARLLGRQAGFSLLESVTASAVLAVVGVCFLSAMAGVFTTTGLIKERVVSASIAERQLEYAKGLPYVPAPTSYGEVAVESGYEVSCVALALSDPNMQKLVVTVARNGEMKLVVEDFKTNR